MAVTLHKLLWGVAKAGDVSTWAIRAYEVPSIGLPVRVAAALLLSIQEEQCPDGWSPSYGPLVWSLVDSKKLLSAGRRLQLGYESEQSNVGSARSPRVRRSESWEVPPHPAYFLPLVDGVTVHADSYVLYCDALLFLTALDGGERILDSLYQAGLAGVPFEDRWAWRSRIHLGEETWKALDDAVRWANAPSGPSAALKSLVQSIRELWCGKISYDDFGAERVDLLLEEGKYLEVVRTVGALDTHPALPPDLKLSVEELSDRLTVRVAQLSHWYSKVPEAFPKLQRADVDEVMRQVAASFAGSAPDSEPDLLLLPEVSVPQSEVATLRQLVAKTGITALYGLYWRELPAAYPGGSNTRKWIVNEAEIVVPLGHNTAGPPTVRWFRVRKPVPAHIEEGLARQVSKRHRLLKGRRWYRFVHRKWGDFSVAICADLIDAEPWRVFRGEMLHLFTVAFNKDVELYDALTWVRAYESYVNVLAVNHGMYGGSFVWTPKGSHARELARLRGSGLFVVADVRMPVKDLLNAQREGVKLAVDAAEKAWAGDEQIPQQFKSPPPGFHRKT